MNTRQTWLLRLAAGNCIDTGRWQSSFPYCILLYALYCVPAHPVKHSHAWKCTPVILTMPSNQSILSSLPFHSTVSTSLDNDVLYDCRIIQLKRNENACLFFYAESAYIATSSNARCILTKSWIFQYYRKLQESCLLVRINIETRYNTAILRMQTYIPFPFHLLNRAY